MDEMEELKKSVSGKSIFDPIGVVPLPPMIEDIERKALEKPETAPLFIKIDKYKDILQNLQDMRRSVSNISEILKVRSELEQIREKSNQALENAFGQFVELAGNLDSQFMAPRVMKPFVKTENIERIDGFVAGIQDEIEKLRKSLDSF